jgi:hypothetical protein
MRATDNVEGLIVGVSKAKIDSREPGGLARNENRAQMLAFRGDDPQASGPGRIDVPFRIDPHADGDSGRIVHGQIDQFPAIGDRPVRLHVIAPDVIIGRHVEKDPARGNSPERIPFSGIVRSSPGSAAATAGYFPDLFVAGK